MLHYLKKEIYNKIEKEYITVNRLAYDELANDMKIENMLLKTIFIKKKLINLEIKNGKYYTLKKLINNINLIKEQSIRIVLFQYYL